MFFLYSKEEFGVRESKNTSGIAAVAGQKFSLTNVIMPALRGSIVSLNQDC